MENKEEFSFTYSAAQQQELEAIRKKYLPAEDDKMARLRRLDSSATQKAQTWAIALGVIGTLVLGTGMSLAMTELGAALGVLAVVMGVLVGVVGLIMVALAYPLYNHVLKKERARIAPEILRLTEELMQ